jgi:Zn-dependent protease
VALRFPAGAGVYLLYGCQQAMLKAGYFRVGRLAGVDLRLHWSVPVAALVFGSLRFEPVSWLAFIAVLFVHALGHALVVRGLGLPLTGIDVAGFGGHCRFRGSADVLEHALIAWGGMAAQALLLIGTCLGGVALGHPTSHAGSLVEHAFVEVNLWILLLNLLPFPPLDGARAWRLFGELGARGWTLPRLAFYPLSRWAHQRRRRRTEGAPSLEVSASIARPRRPRSSVPAAMDASVADGAASDEDMSEKPSAQAQRELAALLERIGDEAGRARKRRSP